MLCGQGHTMNSLEQELITIEQTPDLLGRAMRLAALVSRLFADAGWELVVVGGSAVEFYTEGAYMSGDIDLCRRSVIPIPPRKAQDLMGQLNATGGPRTWKVAGLFVDILGTLENEATTPFRVMNTPSGPVKIMPVELALVERALLAFYPKADAEACDVAKKLLAVCLSGTTSIDWGEVDRLSALPSFNIRDELRQLREEVSRGLQSNA